MTVFELMAKISLDTSEYEQGLNDAKEKSKNFGSSLSSISGGASTVLSGVKTLASGISEGFNAVTSVGERAKDTVLGVTKALAAATTAVAGFVASSVSVGANFDSSMSQVAATMGYGTEELNDSTSEASKTMELLRNTAIEMGSTTAFTATEAADALNYMALAGYDAETSMSMLPTVLNLAAAGGIDLASASDMITDSQSALGLSLDETSQLVDQMAKAASNSNTSVSQLGDAILTVGGTASYMAGGTEEINTVLGVLADNGIKGSEAGTHLRNMLLSLSSPTKDAQSTLDALGVSVFDADGKMRSFSEIFPELNAAMSDLTDQQKLEAFATLFNTRDIASATALLETTTERWEELGGAILDSKDAAEQMAAVQLDNLSGDVTLFKSALEGAQIVIYDNLLPTLRGFVQFGTEAINTLSAAFQEGGLTGAMDALGTILSEGLNMVIQQVPAMAAAGVKLLTALAEGILSNADAVISAAGSVIDAFISGVGAFLSTNGVQLAEKGLEIVEKLLEGFEDIVETVSPYISEFMVQLAEGFSAYYSTMFEVGMEIIAAVAKGIADHPQDVARIAKDFLSKILQSIIDNASTLFEGAIVLVESIGQGIIDNIDKLTEAAELIVGGIVDFIIEAGPDLLVAGLEIIVALLRGLTENMDKIAEAIPVLIDVLVDAIVEFFPELCEIGLQIVLGLVKGLILAIPNLIEAIPKLVGALIDGFCALLGIHSPSTVFEGFGGNIVAGLLEGLTKAWETITAFFDEVIGNLLEFLSGAWESIKETAATAWEAITGVFSDAWQAIQDAFAGVGEFFSGVWDDISGAFEDVAEWFGGVFSDAWDAISKVWNGVTEFFSQRWQDIKDVFSGVKEHFSSIGSNIVEGIKSGISGAWDRFSSWMSKKITGIVESVEGLLGIHSPSTVFAGIGGNMALGLGKGWGDEIDRVTREINDGMNFGEASISLNANAKYSSASEYGAVKAGGDTIVNIYSPKAMDEIAAARQFRRATQQLAMGF